MAFILYAREVHWDREPWGWKRRAWLLPARFRIWWAIRAVEFIETTLRDMDRMNDQRFLK